MQSYDMHFYFLTTYLCRRLCCPSAKQSSPCLLSKEVCLILWRPADWKRMRINVSIDKVMCTILFVRHLFSSNWQRIIYKKSCKQACPYWVEQEGHPADANEGHPADGQVTSWISAQQSFLKIYLFIFSTMTQHLHWKAVTECQVVSWEIILDVLWDLLDWMLGNIKE